MAFNLKDRLGSVITLADESGNVLEHRSYDPFGKPRRGDFIDATNPPPGLQGAIASDPHPPYNSDPLTDRGFTDHEHLDEQDIIHMNGRVFDYNIGRFSSVDPFIQNPSFSQSMNPYSYIMNSPLAGIDPSGYRPKSETSTGSRVGNNGMRFSPGSGSMPQRKRYFLRITTKWSEAGENGGGNSEIGGPKVNSKDGNVRQTSRSAGPVDRWAPGQEGDPYGQNINWTPSMDAIYQLLNTTELAREFIDVMDRDPVDVASFAESIIVTQHEDGTITERNITDNLSGSYTRDPITGYRIIRMRVDLSVYQATITLYHEYLHKNDEVRFADEAEAAIVTERWAKANGWPETSPGFRKPDGSINYRTIRENYPNTAPRDTEDASAQYYTDEQLIYDASNALRE
jgi:RHS repeat-associated protein